MVSALKWVNVSIQDIVNNDYRLEAACYNIESIKANDILGHLSIPLKPLFGSNGIAEVYNLPRFKRVFVEKSDLPIFQPSQITDIYPKPQLYISAKTKTNIDALRVSKGQLLMTCSGTIGKCAIVWDRLDKSIFSHDLLRINSKNEFDTAFIYAYIRTDIGQTLLSAKPYGAVIQHIEPEHLINYFIPYPAEKTRRDIGYKIIQSFEKRDLSNDMIDKAEKLLITYLKLPPIEEIQNPQYDPSVAVNNFSIDISKWQNRLEAKYHDPIIQGILDTLIRSDSEIVPLGDKRLSKDILLPGRFKRVYVEREQGTVFLGGKQIYELDPYSKKYLSVRKHGDTINNQLVLKDNTIGVTRSGTIGRIGFVYSHMKEWVYSDDIIRVIPSSDDLAGYLYVWLSSEYGRALICRQEFGAVIKHIDTKCLSSIEVPVIKDRDVIKQINDYALKAGHLRSEAYSLEQEAIEDVNNLMSLNTMEE